MEAFLRYASEAYAIGYFGIIIVVALLECAVPRRDAGDTLRLRWFGNFGITIIDTLLVRLIFPLAGVGWAIFCVERHWGLFNQLTVPPGVTFVVTVIAVDAVNYGQHYLLHRIPVLWRIHRMHHTDQDYDFSTAVRFHPLESILSTPVLLGAIVLLGASPTGVLFSQLMTVVANFIEHANVRIPASLDRWLRVVIVTPDMHRIHHSRNLRESQSNFSNMFSWWDRLFGTYRAQPTAGHDGMAFGVNGFSERKHLTLPWMIAQPFLRPTATAARVATVASHHGAESA